MDNLEPQGETSRIAELRRLRILDTPPEPEFDQLVALARQICEVPIALVSLVDRDRQWFKAEDGLGACETPRSQSFCQHALALGGILEVPDSHQDPRFAGNPLVLGPPHIRYYAGAPLRARSGHVLGTLCVIDRIPRELTPAQRTALLVLAAQVVAQIELRSMLLETREAALERDRFFNLSGDLMFVADYEGRFVRVNPAFERVFGYETGELEGQRVLDLVHPRDRRETLREWTLLSHGEEIHGFENRCRRNSGMYRWLNWNAVPLPELRLVYAAARDVTEMRESDESRRRMFDESPDLICTAGLDGFLREVNPAFERTLGYPAVDLLARPFTEFVHPDDLEGTGLALQALAGGASIVQYRNRLVRKDGSVRVIEWNAQPSHNPELLHATGRDMTFKQQTEQELTAHTQRQEAIARFGQRVIAGAAAEDLQLEAVSMVRSALGNASCAIFQTLSHGDHLLMTASDGWLPEQVGSLRIAANRQSIQGTVALTREHFISHDLKKDLERFPGSFALGETGVRSTICVPLQARKRSLGALAAFSETAGRFSDQDLFFLQSIAHALSSSLERALVEEERRTAEEALRESEERYRSVIRTMGSGVVLQDKDGVIRTWNESAERILGLTFEQMMGRSSIDPRWRAIREDESDYPGDEHPAMVTLRTGKPLSGELMGVCKPDGSRVWIEINTRPLMHEVDDAPAGVVCSFADVTARRELQVTLAARVAELEAALKREEELRELLPICSYCKRIRDDQNYWQQVEEYITRHTGSRLSHSFCPDCYEKHVVPMIPPRSA